MKTTFPKSYWLNAAKQIPWDVDFEDRHICVPNFEDASENLMVQHFLNHGWHLQLSIDATEHEVYDPQIRLKRKPSARSEFELGDRFEVANDGTHLVLHNKEGRKLELAYLNRNKPNITTNIEQLRIVLSRGVWKRV